MSASNALHGLTLMYFGPLLKLSFLGDTTYSLSRNLWILGMVSLELDITAMKKVLELCDSAWVAQ
jgi:hypothetical protein